MQQHPVPQNIKEFNFKLFGNLTVRQFITLAIPMSLAALVFFSSLAPIIRMPLSLVIGLLGVFVALVPVQGRPFDKWIVAFIRAISSPTQRLWIKEKQIPEFLSVVVTPPAMEERVPEEVASQRRERMIAYLRSLPKDNQSPLDTREQLAIQELNLSTEGAGEGRPLAPIIWPTPRIEEERPVIQVGEADLPKVPHKTTTIRPGLGWFCV